MRRLLQFILNMDARAWRAAAVSFVLFGGVGAVFLFGGSLLGVSGTGGARAWMGGGVQGPWALPAAIGGFTLLAFLGAPQFVLIAAAVVAFGPWRGFAYSWIGTLLSAAIGFLLGRRFGESILRRYGGRGVNQFMDLIGRNGFWASLIVRLVPSAPFIVVNMAAGVTGMRFIDFAGGTALGIVPKIALTAFAGEAAVRAVSRGGAHWAVLAATALVWIAAALAARAWIKRREAGRGLVSNEE